MNRIWNTVYVGDMFSATDISELKRHRIGLVINCAHPPDNIHMLERAMYVDTRGKYIGTGIQSVFIRMQDQSDFDISPFFDLTFSLISNYIKKHPNRGVLVHCRAGVSRSSTIVLAYMIKSGVRFHRALTLAQSRRSHICPNRGFTKSLMDLDRAQI